MVFAKPVASLDFGFYGADRGLQASRHVFHTSAVPIRYLSIQPGRGFPFSIRRRSSESSYAP
jgi:hypothetical protein